MEQTNGIREQLDQNFENLTKWLLCGNIDFDFISESLLPGLCGTAGAPLQVGAMRYDTIIVPGCETLRSSTLERLEAFSASGGNLIFLGSAPKYENAVPSGRGLALWQGATHAEFNRESVLDVLETSRLVDLRGENGNRTANLMHQLRRDGEDCWLFVAHSEMPYNRDFPQKQTVRIALAGEYNVVKYDTLTGQISPVESLVENGKTIVNAQLYDLDSLLLRYTHQKVSTTRVTAAANVETVMLALPHRVDYTLDAPNMYLLDKAEVALDDEPYRPEEELLRADNRLRAQLGWPLRKDAIAQPWCVHEPDPEHTVRLRFVVHSAVEVENVKLALEDADIAVITYKGMSITAKPDGWYIDKSIGTVPIGSLRVGENTIDVTLPFGRKTNVEWCYLLGDFGVQISGEYRQIVAAEPLLGFGDVTTQGLPHYCGNITYHLRVETTGGDMLVTIPHYAGAAVRLELDGQKGYIAYPPYQLELGRIPAGTHDLKVTLLGNCQNGFGPLHLADLQEKWIGPDAWRSVGYAWTECYRLKELGLLSPPIIEEIK